MRLLDNDDLEKSRVMANCRMNWDRQLTGSNGYERELRFHPLDFLRAIHATSGKARWLDLCCGSATAPSDSSVDGVILDVLRGLPIDPVDYRQDVHRALEVDDIRDDESWVELVGGLVSQLTA